MLLGKQLEEQFKYTLLLYRMVLGQSHRKWDIDTIFFIMT